MRSFRTSLLAFLCCTVALVASAASADEWLTFRHDPQRTGASTALARISRPTVTWRRYLGGALTGRAYFTADVDTDGTPDVVYLAGGRAIAKHPDNTIVWESPLLTLGTLYGMHDLDGDGSREIVATGSGGHVFVLSGIDGHVLWVNPPGPIGTVGAVRIADLDHDGDDDLYIGECRCCTIGGSSKGVAYAFPTGFGSATQLWVLDATAGSCGASSDQLADVNGDGFAELVIVGASRAELVVVDSTSGAVRWRIPAPAPGNFYPGTAVHPVNLDADAADELLVTTNGHLASVGGGARRIAVWDLNTVTNAFDLLWEAHGTDLALDEVSTVPGAAGDLDGDGTHEVAFTIKTGGMPRVELRDAITGTVRGALAGVRLVGAVDLDGDGSTELLAEDAAALSAYSVDPMVGFVRRWTLPGAHLVTFWNAPRNARDANATEVAAVNLDADPAPELIVQGQDAMGRETLTALKADGATTTMLAQFTADLGTTLLLASVANGLTQPVDQVITVTSDGYLLVLDDRMQVTNRLVSAEFMIPGMRIGGYYSGAGGYGPTPQIAQLGSAALITRDSRPALIRFDASSASLTSPPAVRWEVLGADSPVLADVTGDGVRDVVTAMERDLVALDAATARTELWRAVDAIPDGSRQAADLLAARRGPNTDIFLVRIDPGAVMHAFAYDGRTGAALWSPFTRALSWGYMLPAAADLDGDGVDDLVTVTNSLHWLRGTDGALGGDNGTFVAYADPMVLDVDGVAPPEVWVHGGFYADRLIGADMVTRAIRSDHTSPNSSAWGAAVQCAGAVAVVEGAHQAPDIWTVRVQDAAPLAHRVLTAGGSHVPGTEPTVTQPGHVGNVTSVRELSIGGPPAVLVGSTDGFLYALDACTLGLLWSLDLRYPVGEPVVGDLAGTGSDDVVITCADGFVYGIGQAVLDAPASVLDTDPPLGITDADVDVIDTLDTLYVSWSAVPGATSYEVGAFTMTGTAVQFPDVQNVGNTTSATLTGLAIRQGTQYQVSVRAIGAAGPGVPARSNGVTVRDRLGPTATVSVAPAVTWPPIGLLPTVNGRCEDRAGLAHGKIEIQDSTATVIVVLEDRDIVGASAGLAPTWDGRESTGLRAPAGTYQAVLTCTDLAMRTNTAQTPFDLVPMDGGAMGGSDGGVMPPVAPGSTCCAIAPGAAPGSLGSLGMLGAWAALVLALWRRRR